MNVALSLMAALLMLAVLASGGMHTTALSMPAASATIDAIALWHARLSELGGTIAILLFGWIAWSVPRVRTLALALLGATVGIATIGATLPLRQTFAGFLVGVLTHALVAGAFALVHLLATPPPHAQLIQDYGWPSLRSMGVGVSHLVAIQVALGAAFRQRMLGLMPHIIGGMLATVLILIAGSFVLQQAKVHRPLATWARVTMVTTFTQVFLGLFVYTLRSVPDQDATLILAISTAHVATGALVLATSAILAIQIRRHVGAKTSA
jgi:heme A synthase